MNVPLAEACQIVAQRAAPGDGDAPLVGSTRREGAAQALSDAVRPVLTDLAREIGLCLRYHSVTFRGNRPQTGIIAGGGAGEPLLPQVLAQETALTLRGAGDVLPVDWSAIDPTTPALSPLASWPVALGLALRTEKPPALKGAA
jgi:type IV pilus assembly protein PilM